MLYTVNWVVFYEEVFYLFLIIIIVFPFFSDEAINVKKEYQLN